MRNILDKIKKHKLLVFLTLFSFILGAAGFIAYMDQAKQPEPVAQPAQETKIFREISSGYTRPNDTIRVMFNRTQGLLQKKNMEKMISFSPKIEGEFRWLSEGYLVFKPKNPLPYGEEYTMKIQTAAFFPGVDIKEKSYKRYLYVPYIQLNVDKPQLRTQKNGNVECLIRLTSNLPITDSKVLEAVKTLKIGSRSPDFTIQKRSTYKLEVKIPNVPISELKNELRFKIDKGIGMKTTFDYRYDLQKLSDFRVVKIDLNQGINANSEMIVRFSNRISPEVDFQEAITITPQVDCKIKPYADHIKIIGDFKYQQNYTVHIDSNIKSTLGYHLKSEFNQTIMFKDIMPQLHFLSDGLYVDDKANQSVGFKTMNLKYIEVDVIQIFPNNVGFYLQSNALEPTAYGMDHSSIRRVGESIYHKKIQLNTLKNKWQYQQLDFKSILRSIQSKSKDGNSGIFYCTLRFNRGAMNIAGLQDRQHYGDSNDPNSYNFLYYNGRRSKPIIFSSLMMSGLIGKKQANISVKYSPTAAPIENAKVTAHSYANQEISSGTTNKEGQVVLSFNKQPYYYKVHKNKQVSYLLPGDMRVNLSNFDINGREAGQDQVMVLPFLDRGVYRPGDTVHLNVVARDASGKWPKKLPLAIQWRNPQNKLVSEWGNIKGKNGLFSFPIRTKMSDPTGTWKAKIKVGPITKWVSVKIETIVPAQLTHSLSLSPETVKWDWPVIEIGLKSRYLFGAPAKDRPVELTAKLTSQWLSFPNYSAYSFHDETLDRLNQSIIIKSGNLNEKGEFSHKWTIPIEAPGHAKLIATIQANVTEKNQQTTSTAKPAVIFPHDILFGVKTPAQLKVNKTVPIEVVALNTEGEPEEGVPIEVTVYRNNRYWWWEYNSFSEYKRQFRTDWYTKEVLHKTIQSKNEPIKIEIPIKEDGAYLIELGGQREEDKHRVRKWITTSQYSIQKTPKDQAHQMTLKTEKDSYKPGETISLKVPVLGAGKVNIEWIYGTKVVKKETLTTYKEGYVDGSLKVKKTYSPNVFAIATAVYPNQKAKEETIKRQLGVVKIKVVDPLTQIPLIIGVDAPLEPLSKRTFRITSSERKKFTYVFALVDEGLLSITQHKWPKLWEWYYQDNKFPFQYMDTYSHLMSPFQEEWFQTIRIGGGVAEYIKTQQVGRTKRRFEPMAIMKGPFESNQKGESEITVSLPNYVGAVRAMVIAVDNKRMGQLNELFEVKNDLMILPTFPRFVGVGDVFESDLNIFSMLNEGVTAQIKVAAKTPLLVSQKPEEEQFLKPQEETLVKVEFEALNMIGTSIVSVNVRTPDKEAVVTVALTVQPQTVRTYKQQSWSLTKDPLNITLNAMGLPGTQKAWLNISKSPYLSIQHRVNNLIQYPYGCLEQRLSKVFGQLALPQLTDISRHQRDIIDQNINSFFVKIREFQLYSGGFSLWPNSDQAFNWGTVYAVHVLQQAKALGYYPPEDVIQDAHNYLAKTLKDTKQFSPSIQAYLIYLLAPTHSDMLGHANRVKESHWNALSPVGQWSLTAAYQRLGLVETVQELIPKLSTDVKHVPYFSTTMGSIERDQAIIASLAFELGIESVQKDLSEALATKLSSTTWYSTQTLGYALGSLGQIDRTKDSQETRHIRIVQSNQEDRKLSTTKRMVQVPITTGFGDQITVLNETEGTELRVTLLNSGIPKKSDLTEPIQKHIRITRTFVDEFGQTIQPDEIKQGTSFWIRLKIEKTKLDHAIDHVALTQVFPAGWEIETQTLLNNEAPPWKSNFSRAVKYRDRRDDRINWFFDLTNNQPVRDLGIKVKAVTVGRFTLPGTLCEAMYNPDYKGQLPAQPVSVTTY